MSPQIAPIPDAETLAVQLVLAKQAAREKVASVLAAALPNWRHAENKNPKMLFGRVFDLHLVDSVKHWTRSCPKPLPTGSIVDLEMIGRFHVGDTKQTVHKRLSRGVPWEAPIAALMMELASRINPDCVIVEAGANVGTITVPMARVSNADVIAFEPEAGNYSDLVRNIALNGLNNVTPSKLACSDIIGRGEMFDVHEKNPGLAKLAVSDGGSVEVTTLDHYLGNRKVGLLKMDVEGHECRVLAGASRVLAEHRPLILCEMLKAYADTLRDQVAKLGYTGHKVFRSDWLFVPDRT